MPTALAARQPGRVPFRSPKTLGDREHHGRALAQGGRSPLRADPGCRPTYGQQLHSASHDLLHFQLQRSVPATNERCGTRDQRSRRRRWVTRSMPGTAILKSVASAATRTRPLPSTSCGDRETTPIHELERYMRCKDCSQVRRYPYKRSHLVALRVGKITASDPPSTWWPDERLEENSETRFDLRASGDQCNRCGG